MQFHHVGALQRRAAQPRATAAIVASTPPCGCHAKVKIKSYFLGYKYLLNSKNRIETEDARRTHNPPMSLIHPTPVVVPTAIQLACMQSAGICEGRVVSTHFRVGLSPQNVDIVLALTLSPGLLRYRDMRDAYHLLQDADGLVWRDRSSSFFVWGYFFWC